MSARGPRESERGAALLAVLLLVAVLAALSVTALEKVRFATRLAANNVASEQAHAFALGAEAFAVRRVAALSGRETGGRTLGFGWIGRAFPIPVPGGIVVARLADGGNCFNLNSAAEGFVPTRLTTRTLGVTQFAALMQAVGIGQADAAHVAASLADWIDADAIPNPGGAEDDAYTRLATPYRTANTLLSDPSELRAVAGVTPAIYAALRPYICTLPSTELSPLDLNTLTPAQAPLVAMLLPNRLPVARAAQLIAARPPLGWPDVSTFWKQTALDAITPDEQVQQGQARLSTRWFRLELDVTLGDAQVRETALIDGGLSPGRVVARSWGEEE